MEKNKREETKQKTSKRILACIDFSAHAEQTMAKALALAKARHARVVAYTVIHRRDVRPLYLHESWYGFRSRWDSQFCLLEQERAAQLRRWLLTHFPDQAGDIEIRVEKGVPARSIVRAAKHLRADLVVLAYKGRSRLSRFFFGSISTAVFRNSPVPVIRPGF